MSHQLLLLLELAMMFGSEIHVEILTAAAIFILILGRMGRNSGILIGLIWACMTCLLLLIILLLKLATKKLLM